MNEEDDIKFVKAMTENKATAQLEAFIKPQLAESSDLLTKELKISNIKRVDLEYLLEISDLIMQVKKYGADKFAQKLLIDREVFLSATSSVEGFERNATVTNINKQIIEEREDKKLKDRLLRRRSD